MICGVINQVGAITCVYLLDADDAEIDAFYKFSGAKLVANAANTGGTFTVKVPPPVSSYSGAMAPAGFSRANVAFGIDNTSGKKAIEWALNMPTPVGDSLYSYLSLRSEATTYNVIEVYITAAPSGVFLAEVNVGSGRTNVYSNNSLPSCPSRIGVLMDSVAGKLHVYFDGVALTLTGDTLPSNASMYPNIFIAQGDNNTGAGQTITAELVTSASKMTGTYPPGTTDICGNPL